MTDHTPRTLTALNRRRVNARLALVAMFMVAATSCATAPDNEEEEVGGSAQAVTAQSGSVAQGTYAKYLFTKVAGHRYTTCLNVSSGDADLYGDYAAYPTTSTYQFRSINGGPKDDCIVFTSSTAGAYYLSVYGYAPGISAFNLRIVDADVGSVPN
jgi:hypothetical protein